MRAAEIVVVGSLNEDLVFNVPRIPAPGETVLGSGHFANRGGKGANQAVAAARLGRSVAMVGCVGDDPAGDSAINGLTDEGVDTTYVRRMDAARTGMASIAVTPEGENAIVVSPGANALVSLDLIGQAAELIATAAIVLLQLEIPIEAAKRAVSLATGTAILNPAPAPAQPLDRELLSLVDVLVPNEHEAEAALGHPWDEAKPPSGLTVVVTRGEIGATLLEGEEEIDIAAPTVAPVDTTAAGDAFCGALADALVRGESLPEACRWAAAAGAVTVTRAGAQDSLPSRREVLEMIRSAT